MNTEVKAINSNDVDELTNKVKMAASRIMMSSYTKLIGVVLYRFKLQIDDNGSVLPADAGACVRWSKSGDGFKIIPEIWFSPTINKYSMKMVAFIIIHEICHVLDLHMNRSNGRDGMLWNLACDHVINNRILQDIDNGNTVVEAPSEMFIVKEWQEENLTAEEVYDRLKEEQDKNKLTVKMSDDGGKIIVDYKGQTYEIDVDTLDDGGEGANGNESQSKEVKEIKSIIKGAIESDVFKQQNDGRGNTKGGLLEYLQEIVEIKIPWDMLVEKAIHKCIPVKSDNRSWRVLNKRMMSHGLTLPSSDVEEDNESNLYIVVDNSASVGTEELMKFASIIVNSSGFFNKTIIFKHDVDIQEIVEFDSYADSKGVKEAVKGVGRGGTCHIDVFDEIERRVITNKDVDEVGIVMILTDYESNIEQIWSNYEWVKKIPIKIILTDPINVASFVDDEPIMISKIEV